MFSAVLVLARLGIVVVVPCGIKGFVMQFEYSRLFNQDLH